MLRSIYFVFFYFALISTGFAVEVNGWVADSPPVVPVKAAYLTITNPSDSPVTISHLKSPHFRAAELHETVEEAGMVSMRQLDVVSVEAHGQLTMQPGGMHVMLFDPQEKLVTGDCVELTVVFQSGAAVTTRLLVKKARDSGEHVHAHH